MSEARARLLRRSAVAVALGLAFVLGTRVGGPDAPAEAHDHDHAEWTCSMHPQVRQPTAGACPICGMDLIPVGDGDAGPPERVELSERARVLARLRTAEVRRQDAAAEVRLLGRIEPAETTRRNVTTWIGGRIDRLHVNTTGERVRRGQPIATLYSPEVYAAHQDLLTAEGQVARLAEATPSARAAAEAARDAARERLRLLGMPEARVAELAAATEPTRAVVIRSPFGGTVLERVGTEGAYVDVGATLYRVADLGTLWVQLDAYESDLPRLAVGQSVQLRVDALPGEQFEGRVDFIDPTLDPQRRTARVRVVVDNGGGRLRPGLFAEAVVQAEPADASSPLVVPDTAPLFTGRRSVVYVEVDGESGPAYEPRTVRLGPRLGSVYPVLAGLVEGERVVSRGAFALDADLQIRGGASMMSQPDDRSEDDPPIALSTAQRAALKPVLERYLDLQRALAEDDVAAATKAAGALAPVVAAVELPPAAREAWTPIAEDLTVHAGLVARADGIDAARIAFEPLSAAVEAMLGRFGNPLGTAVHVAFCSMAMDDRGARWVQAGEVVDNAYFGAMMRRCGEIEAAIAPGTYLDAPGGAR